MHRRVASCPVCFRRQRVCRPFQKQFHIHPLRHFDRNISIRTHLPTRYERLKPGKPLQSPDREPAASGEHRKSSAQRRWRRAATYSSSQLPENLFYVLYFTSIFSISIFRLTTGNSSARKSEASGCTAAQRAHKTLCDDAHTRTRARDEELQSAYSCHAFSWT